MTYQMAPFRMTLSYFQGHSPSANLYKCDPSYFSAADWLQLDNTTCRRSKNVKMYEVDKLVRRAFGRRVDIFGRSTTTTYQSHWPSDVTVRLSSQVPFTRCSLKAPFTRYNLLSSRLSNRFDNRVNGCIHDTTGCQTRCQGGCHTGLTSGCIVYTNSQPVVKPVWQPVWQTAVSCIQPVVKPTTRFDNRLNEQWLFVQHGWTNMAVRSTRLSNRLYNRFDSRFDNRLYHVYKHSTGCPTGLTTGCIV